VVLSFSIIATATDNTRNIGKLAMQEMMKEIGMMNIK
jgi:hypothetical protein